VTVTNDRGQVHAETRVTITNQAPLARAGQAQTVTVNSGVTLNGSMSSDPDGHTPLIYGWRQIGGTSVTLSNAVAAAPTFVSPAAPAILTFTLVVTDAYGAWSNPDQVTVNVQDIAVSGLSAVSNAPTTLGRSNLFTATASGTNVTYMWAFGDGAIGAGRLASHTYPSTGIYTARVTATNGMGTMWVVIPVTITNLAPTANAGPDQGVYVSTLVTLNGSGSTDPDGHTPLIYGWRQTGGSVVTLDNAAVSQPTFTAPAAPSILTFTLMVTDARGLTAVAQDQVVIAVNDVPITNLSVVSSSPTTLGQATIFTVTAGGSNVVYVWDCGDGSSTGGSRISHTYANAGNYTVVVTATNGAGRASTLTQVSITNRAPVANAGSAQTVFVNAVTTLDGSGSYDPDGHLPLSYAWRQTGGSPVILNNALISNSLFTAPSVPAVLTFTLTVTDARGLPATVIAQTVVTIVNSGIGDLKVLNSSPTTLGKATVVTVTSTGSNVVYTWNFGDSQTGTGATASHVYAAAGLYTATVTATNNVGQIHAETHVTVTNLAPVASAGQMQTVTVGSTAKLDGSASFDPDGHIPLVYSWRQMSGPPVVLSSDSDISPSFVAPNEPSILAFALVVTDAAGLIGVPSNVVTVTVNDVPIGGLLLHSSSPNPLGQVTEFTATIASGTNVTYEWAFGDGQTAIGSSATHSYLEIGTYTATLTATNSTGSVWDDIPVTIISPICVPPQGITLTSMVTDYVNERQMFNAWVVPETATLPLTYTWQATDHPSIITVSASLHMSQWFTWSAFGTQTVTVSVANVCGFVTSSDPIDVLLPPRVYIPIILDN
jgi:PKD repeat protein